MFNHSKGNKMKRLFLFFITIAFFFGFTKIDEERKALLITSDAYQQHVNYLASDELEGRMTGTEGDRLAAQYIQKHFHNFGLKPLFGESYLQDFPFDAEKKHGDNNFFTLTKKGNEKDLDFNEDFSTITYSDNITFTGGVVFVGYGISAPNLEWDDYEGIDVTGKAVLVMRNSPEPDEPHSKFSRASSMRFKASVAKDKGASAIIFVNGHYPENVTDEFIITRFDRGSPIKDLAVVQISRNLTDEIFQSQNLSFSDYQKEMNEKKKPSSFNIDNISVKITTEVQTVKNYGQNVAGYLPGNDPILKDEFIIIGAHHDHIGWGDFGTMFQGSSREIHNGADDNASGTAGVIELARQFSSVKDKIRRSIIFMTFSGEELGLIGSQYFTQNSPVKLENVVSMFNLDMIGRINDENTLILNGTGSSSIWHDLFNELNNNNYFQLSFNDDSFSSSDHASFYSKEIPVVFFFTGIHGDYHRPTDTAEKINSEKAVSILNFIFNAATKIDQNDERPDYIKVERSSTGGAMSFRVYVGVIPDYSSSPEGFKISGVNPNSPAEKAGLRGGDIITQIGEKKINDIYDYTYVLSDHNPGDKVELRFLREGKQQISELEFGTR